ncbi:unnamed protein product [Bursaphelenchus okinawaensis]|uniref:Uncharacterized protein n=1 Tax=Bursaphelenchus okinawaensis TaxID=465554 RepID=A0A811KB89_9BILA|nr:unnamed protein product [Bursaphelenchus okinawaensis]CAG9095276.1 unnamed protein product [Bursaphelenchus okinawaensis]
MTGRKKSAIASKNNLKKANGNNYKHQKALRNGKKYQKPTTRDVTHDKAKKSTEISVSEDEKYAKRNLGLIEARKHQKEVQKRRRNALLATKRRSGSQAKEKRFV